MDAALKRSRRSRLACTKLETMKLKTITLAAALVAGLTVSAHAATITIGAGPPTQRTASLTDATAGFGGEGNATVADVNGGFGSLAPWTEVASMARGDNATGSFTVGLLTIALSAGDKWGNDPDNKITGTWAIDASFWTQYADAAISMHVGGGRQSNTPDHFVWHVADGATSGTWSYDGSCCNGGGLSNFKLYGSGTGTSVPDGGSTLALIGLAVAGLGLARRKLS